MERVRRIGRFLLNEWPLWVLAAAIVTLYTVVGASPHYEKQQLVPIFLLWALFVAVKGIEQSGLLASIASYLQRGRWPAPKLVLLTFALSTLLTIDVTLVTVLPIILAMRVTHRDRLFLLAAFTTHAGAALAPFGTPQNIFIYTYYDLSLQPFISSIAPFSLSLGILFLVYAFFVRVKVDGTAADDQLPSRNPLQGVLFLLLLGICVLTVLRVVPWQTAAIVLIAALLINPRSLSVDYRLLIAFLLFLGLANQIAPFLYGVNDHPLHPFLLSSLLSQVVSNVPSTLLLHPAVSDWRALLWGSNVGSFGTPVAALANLITWRIHAAHHDPLESRRFLRRMTLWGFVIYGMGIVIHLLYLSLRSYPSA